MSQDKIIIVNGFKEKISSDETIASLIKRFDEQDKSLIVEKNGKFVYPPDYPKTRLEDGDSLEFINPNFGG